MDEEDTSEPDVGALDTVTPSLASPESDTRQMDRLRAATRAKLFGGEPEPTRIGRYVVLERLGAGGMGVVYLAHDADLDRRVAVKVLRADAREGSAGRTRLVREAQAMAKLSHAHVVHVYEVGRQDELVFVAMEYIPGQNLREWAQRERNVAEILEVHLQAGQGLAAAHAVGLVHRDYKPENVMVADSGGARVLDFGLARPAGPSVDEREALRAGDDTGPNAMAPLTETGALLGTPAYMAPEQLRGETADARADQFAFCVTLFEALYGERPFGGATLAELSANVLSSAVVVVDPDARRVPAHVHRALLRGLATRPDDRFASMGELLLALSPTVSARPKWQKSLLLGAIVLGLGALGWASWRDAPAPSRVDAEPSLPDPATSPFEAILESSDLPPLIEVLDPRDPYAVTVHRLANGLTVYLSPDHDAPMLTAAVVVRAGTVDESDGATGVAHLLEHTLYNGTSRLGALDWAAEEPLVKRREELARELQSTTQPERRAAILAEIEANVRASAKWVVPDEYASLMDALGSDQLNGLTTDQMTCFYVSLPSVRFEAWAAVEAERLRRPVFRTFFSDLGAVFEEYRRSTQGDRATLLNVRRALFEGTPFGRVSVGELEDLERPPFAAMVEFHERYYVPNNIAIVLAGDIDAARALPVLEREFGTWSPRELPDRAAPLPALPPGRSEHALPSSTPIPLVIAWRNARASAHDEERRQLALRIIGTEVQRALRDSGRVPFGLLMPNEQEIVAFLQPAPGVSVREAEDAFFAELKALRERGPAPATLAAARADYQRSGIESRRSTLSRMLRIASSYAAGRAWHGEIEQIGGVEGMTPIIEQELDRLLHDGFVVLERSDEPYRPPIFSTPTVGRIEYASKGHSAFWTEIASLPAASPEPQFVLEGRHYQADDSDGGLDLRTEKGDGLTTVRLEYPFGAADDPHACNAVNLWANSGTADSTYDQLRERLASNGVTLTSSCYVRTSGVTIQGLDEGLSEVWPLVSAWLAAPVPREEDLARVRPAWVSAVGMSRNTEAGVDAALRGYALYGEASLNRLAASSAASGSVTLDRLAGTLDDVRSRRPVVLWAGGTEGMPLPELPTGDPLALRPSVARKVDGPVVFVLDDDQRDQVRISLDFVRPPLRREERLPADMLEVYLSGGMSGLLFYELRTSRSLAYEVSASLVGGGGADDDAVLRLGFATGPETVHDAIAVVLDAVSQPIEPTRFAAARDSLEATYRGRRIPPSRVPEAVLGWRRAGFDGDPLLSTWPQLSRASGDELAAFLRSFTAVAPIVTVQGDLDRIDVAALERLGEIRRLTLDDIFASE